MEIKKRRCAWTSGHKPTAHRLLFDERQSLPVFIISVDGIETLGENVLNLYFGGIANAYHSDCKRERRGW